jgi:hypothetical protein
MRTLPHETGTPARPTLKYKKVWPSPFLRTEAATAPAGKTVYLFGGFVEKLEARSQFDVDNPATDSKACKKYVPTHPPLYNPPAKRGGYAATLSAF